MRLYRLTRAAYADMSGAGGLHVTGRWHNRPLPIVYASESRALAILEVLVHLDVDFASLPDDYVFQVIDADTESIETLNRDDLKPGGAANDPAAFGCDWLISQRSALLVAPSAVLPREFNILLNPVHPATASFRFTVEDDMIWDRRLFQTSAE